MSRHHRTSRRAAFSRRQHDIHDRRAGWLPDRLLTPDLGALTGGQSGTTGQQPVEAPDALTGDSRPTGTRPGAPARLPMPGGGDLFLPPA